MDQDEEKRLVGDVASGQNEKLEKQTPNVLLPTQPERGAMKSVGVASVTSKRKRKIIEESMCVSGDEQQTDQTELKIIGVALAEDLHLGESEKDRLASRPASDLGNAQSTFQVEQMHGSNGKFSGEFRSPDGRETRIMESSHAPADSHT